MIAVDPASTLTSRERFPCFDGLRAIAAGGVVLLHVALISGFTFSESDTVGPYFARGEAGVYLFFLISGYLLYRPFVAARFDRVDAPSVRGYARRRALRIIPAYWVALTILVLIFDTRHRDDITSIGDVIVYYGFLQIYFKSTVVGGLQQAWSLCTEVAFYVFLPFWAAAMRVARRGAPETRCQNLSTMPTSNVTSESVLDDSTPPNLTVGSNRRYRRPGVRLHGPPNATSRPPPTSSPNVCLESATGKPSEALSISTRL